MKRRPLLLVGVVSMCCLVACDESFNPSGPVQTKMAVYSVLSTESDSQYVRIYSTYNAPGTNPLTNPEEVPVTDANVIITSQDGAKYEFHPIDVVRSDKSRYSSDIKAYFCYPFRPEKGKAYKLTVTSLSRGTATASVTVPGYGTLSPDNTTTLGNPWNPLAFPSVNFTISLSPLAKAFVVHFYVDYLALVGGGWQQERVEVPVAIRTIGTSSGARELIYPQVIRRTSPRDRSGRVESYEHFSYLTSAYKTTIESILQSGISVKFRQAVFHLIQFDDALYNYYSISNGFRDRYSIRLDEPDYTNIKGGVGVFGSAAVDSSFWPLLENFATGQTSRSWPSVNP